MSESNKFETTLETERLLLEPLRECHAKYLFTLLADPQIYAFIPQDPPESLAELQTRYKRLETRHSPEGDEVWLNWVIYLKTEKQYAGIVQATLGEEKIGYLAYQLSPKFWGFGYATEACQQVIKTLFTEYPVTEVIADVDTRNVASYKLLERLLFERVTFKERADFFKGAYSDEYVYRLKHNRISQRRGKYGNCSSSKRTSG
jgi:[ribosomal protein S5]-alanine N-acetyltransferase